MKNTEVPPVAVFGTVQKVNEIKHKMGIKISTTKSEHEKDKPLYTSSEEAFRIGGRDEIPTITEEERAILRKTLLKDNPENVYMQEDVSFYDGYYLSEHTIDNGLMDEVRKIRRIYKNYPKYLYACYIRDIYLDILEEQYGTSSPLAIAKGLTLVDVPKDTFIPPEPIYSRNAPDYEQSLSHRIGATIEGTEMTPEETMELLQDIGNALDVRPEDIKVNSHGIMAKKEVLDYYFGEDAKQSTAQFSGRTINVKDLDAIQKIMRSWSVPDQTLPENEDYPIPFPESEAGMWEQIRWRASYELTDALEHPVQELGTDMVYDEVTKKPMTRQELQQRSMVRMLGEHGWDALKVMSQLGIGSKVDRMLDRTKRKRRKKSRKKAASFFEGIMGDEEYDDPAMDIESLRSALFDV